MCIVSLTRMADAERNACGRTTDDTHWVDGQSWQARDWGITPGFINTFGPQYYPLAPSQRQFRSLATLRLMNGWMFR